MICTMCRTAGDFNSAGKFDDAEVWHSRCMSPASCSCQHGQGEGWVQNATISARS
jgi:hypothetical protein